MTGQNQWRTIGFWVVLTSLFYGAAAGANDKPIQIVGGPAAGGAAADIATANWLASFVVPADADPYDRIPHELYWICLEPSATFDSENAQCDFISFTEGVGPTRAVIPFAEALDPVRGQEVHLWVRAVNVQTNQVEVSHSYPMRAALSNIALRPPGAAGQQPPFDQVFPGADDVFTSTDDFLFRWPRTTTGEAGVFGGFNHGATKHILSLQFQQSSASCERTVFACPGAGNVCTSTDPLDCALDDRGYCTYTEPCARNSGKTSFTIPLAGLTTNFEDIGPGMARTQQIGIHEFVEFIPDQSGYASVMGEVNADRVFWRVATCAQIGGRETCGKSENVAHLGTGTIGIPGNGGDEGGGGFGGGGIAFGDSPLVDTFGHPACLNCHLIFKEAQAGAGRGHNHAQIGVVGGIENLDDPDTCAICHGSDKAPQILGTSYAETHGLDAAFPGQDYESWWAWFAPHYEGGLVWPDFLMDPASPDYDPSTACAQFVSETPTPEAMKHHLFEDPRVVWSIVGGEKPNGFIDELAPPGSALTEFSSTAERVAVLETWEDWVNEWVDGGMNCGTTYTTNSGGGPNEPVNTTPPTTTSDGSTGTWVGGDPGSGDTTITHLDCTPDQDSASPQCAWTLFACGSDDIQVQARITVCDEASATPYTQAGVSPSGLCETAASSCYKYEPGVGGGVYWSLVEIPAEIGDYTRLSYFSIDAEGNQEVVRTETYEFVDADLIAPASGVELFYDIDADEHKLRFSCIDNSENCMIFYKSNDPGQDTTPEFDMSTQILNSNGNPFDAHDNVLGFLKTDRVQRIRWAAVDTAQPLSQRNAEFDRLCIEDNLDLCPGKRTLQNECVASCEATIRADCEMSCPASGGGGAEEDCVAACVAASPIDCRPGCVQTCEPTNTACPGTGPAFGVPAITDCVSRTNPIQCYHEFVYDPDAAYDMDPPEVEAVPTRAPRADGTYEGGFLVSLQCADPVNECAIYYTTDGSMPTADPRNLYTESIIIPDPISGRTATTTLKYFTQDDAVPPNSTAVVTRVFTVALPHTDDDFDGFTEDQGDCNDGNDSIFPGAPEMCDLIDNDCNGIVDDPIGGSCSTDLVFANGFEP